MSALPTHSDLHVNHKIWDVLIERPNLSSEYTIDQDPVFNVNV